MKAKAQKPVVDTRERILDAAERLFMEHGYDGTSMRMITSEAAVNLAAVNYHFGSKEVLMQEVFRRRLGWLNEERTRALDALEAEAGGGPVKPSKIILAFFGAALRMAEQQGEGGRVFLRLMGRTLTEPSAFIKAFLAEENSGVLDRYKAALFKALPGVPKAEIAWRLHFMLGAMAFAIAGTDALAVGINAEIDDPNAARMLGPRLMAFLLGGLRAPLPQAGEIDAATVAASPWAA